MVFEILETLNFLIKKSDEIDNKLNDIIDTLSDNNKKNNGGE